MVLPELPCLSWLWREVGRLSLRLELDAGLASWTGFLGATTVAVAVEVAASGAAVVVIASILLRLRLL